MFGFNCLALLVAVIDFTPWGVLARWTFLFVTPVTVSWVSLLSLFSLSPSFPASLFLLLPPLALLQTATANQAMTFTAVFYITAEQPPVLGEEVNKPPINV